MPAAAYKLTPRALGDLRELLRNGASVRDAARAVHVHERTLRGWIRDGRRDGAPLPLRSLAKAAEEGRAGSDALPAGDDDELRRRLQAVVINKGLAGNLTAARDALRFDRFAPPREPSPSPATPMEEWLAARRAAS